MRLHQKLEIFWTFEMIQECIIWKADLEGYLKKEKGVSWS